MKYKYFIAFVHCTNNKIGYGNVVIETDVNISDFDNINDMQKWIYDAQNYIQNNSSLENVVLLNFKLIN